MWMATPEQQQDEQALPRLTKLNEAQGQEVCQERIVEPFGNDTDNLGAQVRRKPRVPV